MHKKENASSDKNDKSEPIVLYIRNRFSENDCGNSLLERKQRVVRDQVTKNETHRYPDREIVGSLEERSRFNSLVRL